MAREGIDPEWKNIGHFDSFLRSKELKKRDTFLQREIAEKVYSKSTISNKSYLKVEKCLKVRM